MKRAPGALFLRVTFSTAGMAVQGIARFLYTLTIGRIAGAEALGETTALLSVAVYLSLAWPAGAGIAASRFLPLREAGPAALTVLKRSFWISSIALSVAAAPLALWVTGDLALAVTSSLLVFGYNAYVFARGALMGEDRIRWAAIADTFSSLAAITALILVLLGGLHWALLLPLAAGYLLFAITSWPRNEAESSTPPLRVEVLRFTTHATVGALVTGGLLPATMVFVRAFDSAEQAGVFAAGLTLATPASLVSQAVNQVLIPYFVRLRADGRDLRTSHIRLFTLTTGPFLVVFGGLILLAPWMLSFFFGHRYQTGAPSMQVLLAVVFLISATCAPSALLVATGREKLYATIWTIAFLSGMATMISLGQALGQWGALLGFAVGAGGGSVAIIVAAFASTGSPKPLTG